MIASALLVSDQNRSTFPSETNQKAGHWRKEEHPRPFLVKVRAEAVSGGAKPLGPASQSRAARTVTPALEKTFGESRLDLVG